MAPADRTESPIAATAAGRIAAALASVRESERDVRFALERLEGIADRLAAIRVAIVATLDGEAEADLAQYRIDAAVIAIDRFAADIAAKAASLGGSTLSNGARPAILGRLASGGDAALATGRGSVALALVHAAEGDVAEMRTRLLGLLSGPIASTLARLSVAAENAAAAGVEIDLRRAG